RSISKKRIIEDITPTKVKAGTKYVEDVGGFSSNIMDNKMGISLEKNSININKSQVDKERGTDTHVAEYGGFTSYELMNNELDCTKTVGGDKKIDVETDMTTPVLREKLLVSNTTQEELQKENGRLERLQNTELFSIENQHGEIASSKLNSTQYKIMNTGKSSQISITPTQVSKTQEEGKMIFSNISVGINGNAKNNEKIDSNDRKKEDITVFETAITVWVIPTEKVGKVENIIKEINYSITVFSDTQAVIDLLNTNPGETVTSTRILRRESEKNIFDFGRNLSGRRRYNEETVSSMIRMGSNALRFKQGVGRYRLIMMNSLITGLGDVLDESGISKAIVEQDKRERYSRLLSRSNSNSGSITDGIHQQQEPGSPILSRGKGQECEIEKEKEKERGTPEIIMGKSTEGLLKLSFKPHLRGRYKVRVLVKETQHPTNKTELGEMKNSGTFCINGLPECKRCKMSIKMVHKTHTELSLDMLDESKVVEYYYTNKVFSVTDGNKELLTSTLEPFVFTNNGKDTNTNSNTNNRSRIVKEYMETHGARHSGRRNSISGGVCTSPIKGGRSTSPVSLYSCSTRSYEDSLYDSSDNVTSLLDDQSSFLKELLDNKELSIDFEQILSPDLLPEYYSSLSSSTDLPTEVFYYNFSCSSLVNDFSVQFYPIYYEYLLAKTADKRETSIIETGNEISSQPNSKHDSVVAVGNNKASMEEERLDHVGEYQYFDDTLVRDVQVTGLDDEFESGIEINHFSRSIENDSACDGNVNGNGSVNFNSNADEDGDDDEDEDEDDNEDNVPMNINKKTDDSEHSPDNKNIETTLQASYSDQVVGSELELDLSHEASTKNNNSIDLDSISNIHDLATKEVTVDNALFPDACNSVDVDNSTDSCQKREKTIEEVIIKGDHDSALSENTDKPTSKRKTPQPTFSTVFLVVAVIMIVVSASYYTYTYGFDWHSADFRQKVEQSLVVLHTRSNVLLADAKNWYTGCYLVTLASVKIYATKCSRYVASLTSNLKMHDKRDNDIVGKQGGIKVKGGLGDAVVEYCNVQHSLYNPIEFGFMNIGHHFNDGMKVCYKNDEMLHQEQQVSRRVEGGRENVEKKHDVGNKPHSGIAKHKVKASIKDNHSSECTEKTLHAVVSTMAVVIPTFASPDISTSTSTESSNDSHRTSVRSESGSANSQTAATQDMMKYEPLPDIDEEFLLSLNIETITIS
ncbi:hypothetical protein AX774_g4030, partial [Zancudomyces culisetae]